MAEAAIIVVCVRASCLVLAVVACGGVCGVVTCAFTSEVFWIIASLHFASRDVPQVITDTVILGVRETGRLEVASSVVVRVAAEAGWVRCVATDWLEPAGGRVTCICAGARVVRGICACRRKHTCLAAIELETRANWVTLVLADRRYRARAWIGWIRTFTNWVGWIRARVAHQVLELGGAIYLGLRNSAIFDNTTDAIN